MMENNLISNTGTCRQELVKCPVCPETRHKTLFKDRNRRDRFDYEGTYVQCLKCSLVYLVNPLPWENLVQLYSSLEQDFTANSGRQDPKNVIEEATKRIPFWRFYLRKTRFRLHSWPSEVVPLLSKRILDLGCGNGSRLLDFSRRGYDVWGIDVGAQSIELCRKILPNGHFVQGELQNTKLEAASFDYIRIDNALEHMPNPREVIREGFRLLRPSGKIMIYVPNGRSFTMRFLKGGSISSWMPFHLQLFTRKSLKKLLEDCGFKNIKIYGYNPLSWIPMSLAQTRNNNKSRDLLCYPKWLDKAFLPIGWFFVCMGLPEELMAIGEK